MLINSYYTQTLTFIFF